MSGEGEWHQMSFEELLSERRGDSPDGRSSDEEPELSHVPRDPGAARLLESVLERRNLQLALRRVKRNRGGPGVDEMRVEELSGYLREHWPRLREEILAGRYRPAPVLLREIPKPGGGTRQLGIPTVLDRFIQQAILQVLQPLFDAGFSDHSYGFRPGRSAHGAVRRARDYVAEGRRYVVDVDLASFFDRVNHDVLMGKLSCRIEDRRLLRLIRRYLSSGVMAAGVVIERYEGTPQGGPLSPLLANVLLDEVDKELERRGHAFVRYADDGQVYVRSRRAGERVFALFRRLYGRLRLRVNESKSRVCSAFHVSFLGFGFWAGRGGGVKLRIARKSLGRMRDRVRQLTRRNSGRSVAATIGRLRSFLIGWRGYFRLAETPRVFDELDGWIRRRLRALQLKHWKRGPTAYRALRSRGASADLAAHVAANLRRWWHNAAMKLHHILDNAHFDELGLPRLGR